MIVLPKEKIRAYARAARQTKREVSAVFFKATRGVIQAGAFKGVKLLAGGSWGNDIVSQLFGIYEQQLWPILTEKTYDQFIDIGAADGYWAVGMVASNQAKTSIAFEMRERGQRRISRLASKNNVEDRVDIRAEANTQSLAELAPEDGAKILVMIDIEGAEYDLVTPEFLSRFKNAQIIIELHPSMARDQSLIEKMHTACAATHAVERIDDSLRDFSALRSFAKIPDTVKYLLISEDRGMPQEWMILRPR